LPLRAAITAATSGVGSDASAASTPSDANRWSSGGEQRRLDRGAEAIEQGRRGSAEIVELDHRDEPA
jgi:hypothetical protein